MSDRVQALRVGILHEICLPCVHKPLVIKEGLFKDSPKTHTGTGCYEKLEGSEYCLLAHKVADEILSFLASQGLGWAEELTLPIKFFHPDDNNTNSAYREGLDNMLKVGAVKFVPLKEEVKEDERD